MNVGIGVFNLVELQGNSYLIVGCLIALSLMYGGPATHLFATAVAEYLLSINQLTVAIEDVPDYDTFALVLAVGLDKCVRCVGIDNCDVL